MKKFAVIILVILTILFGSSFRYFQALFLAQSADHQCSAYLVNPARARVTEVYALPVSTPIRACISIPGMSPAQYGATHFFPFAPAINVIGPKGTNIDVIAHEWVHAETEHVLGFVARNYKMPVWLDEGIAMQVDDRSAYSREALKTYMDSPDAEVPLLEGMAKAKDFFTQGEQGRLHYALAKCVVAEAVKMRSVPGASIPLSIKQVADLHTSEPQVFGAAYNICAN